MNKFDEFYEGTYRKMSKGEDSSLFSKIRSANKKYAKEKDTLDAKLSKAFVKFRNKYEGLDKDQFEPYQNIYYRILGHLKQYELREVVKLLDEHGLEVAFTYAKELYDKNK